MLSYGADTSSLWMRLEATVLRRLPPRWRRPARRLLYLPVDLFDAVLGRRPDMVPPRGMITVGAGDFRATGEHYLAYLRQHAGLGPDSRVLDVGCGIGRMAAPMTRFLERGTYDGIDVAVADLRWCRRQIGRRRPGFRFHHADVYHREYNPGGKLAAAEYRVPFLDGSFDVVLASSLFSHLLAAEAGHYLAEISRVLVAGGTSFLTFFLLNDESRGQIDAGACGLAFRTPVGDAWIHDAKNPEAAVAYDEPFIRRLHAGNGLELTEPVLYGCWCCREEYTSYQDIVVALKGPRS